MEDLSINNEDKNALNNLSKLLGKTDLVRTAKPNRNDWRFFRRTDKKSSKRNG